MSVEASEYVIDEANEEQLKSWLNAGQWTREEATLLFLEINPRSVSSECFSTFSGRGAVQYEYYDFDRKKREPCTYDDDDEPVYLTAEQDALFHKTLERRFKIDLQLNSRETAEPHEWIELACKKEIYIPWLELAVARGLYGKKAEPDAVSTEPVVEESVGGSTEWDLLATPEKLIAAFGTFSGMNKEWFNSLGDKPQLQAARRIAGVGGKHSRAPYFDVFLVMKWLIDPKNKVGSKMTEPRGWRILKSQFPKIYEHFEYLAPDPD